MNAGIGKFPAKLGTLSAIESLCRLWPKNMDGSGHIAQTVFDMESASVPQKSQDRMFRPILLGASGKDADGFLGHIFGFRKA